MIRKMRRKIINMDNPWQALSVKTNLNIKPSFPRAISMLSARHVATCRPHLLLFFSFFLRIYPAFIAGRCACRLRSQQLMGEAFRLRNAHYTLKRHVPSLHVTPPSQNMPSAHPLDVPRDTFVWLRARRIQKSKA